MTTSTTNDTTPSAAMKARQAFRPEAAAPVDLLSDGDPELVTAAFATVDDAQNALQRLFRCGFQVDQISIVAPATEADGLEPVETLETPVRSAKRWVASGALFGAVSGSAIATGFVATAGLGALAVTGPLVLGIASGAMVGSLVGAMVRRGVAPEAAHRYLRAACDGSVLVAADAKNDEQARQARIAFHEAGAAQG